MIEVYQSEWCPFSRMVRERLTELGVDYIARQVEPSPGDRDRLEEVSRQRTIPVVVLEDGTVLAGETEDIVAELTDRLDGWEHEEDHRDAARAHGVRV